MPSKEEVLEMVTAALVDALGVDDDEVTAEATMVGDLGAESIDFLDIVFRLEKSFGIEIPRLWRHAKARRAGASLGARPGDRVS